MTVSVSPADPPPPNGVDAWLAGRRPLLVWTVVFFGLFVLLYGQ